MEENYNDTAEQPKNKKKIWIGVLVAILAIVVIGVALGGGDNTVGVRELEVTDVKMTVEYSDLFEGWDVTITGKAKNISTKNYSYASVEFSVYDEHGNNLGTADTSMNNLASGETWSFEASWLEYSKDKPVSCKLSDATTW